jgi:ElaB/YqjD/DUF883 family membrane-anchored ribosome-binding protein
MNNREKLTAMDKIIRELEDLVNSQTSVLKKIGQIEAENINLGDKYLDEKLPDVFEEVDTALTQATAIHAEYIERRNQFVKDNNLDVPEETEA